ncbi:SidA/IucD/PvdA family monooxygenase [Glutamicibacter arilaitensis]|uniref:SidA/IucD/PvdA family monooxygenase n=1 Tax=Glutamicibacter arilaitensis TaxID=256701 RepID=UPI003F98C2E3
MSRPEITADQSYDVVGLGFGPSNMALATAIHEHNRAVGTEPSLKALFLDRASEPGWHKNLLFEDASMQVAFAKDLASFRNPTSELTFMNFLHTQGRLEDFFNRGSMAPLRIEFVAYLRWAAEQLSDYVRYSSEVVRVVPRTSGGRITGYEVDIADESGVRTGLPGMWCSPEGCNRSFPPACAPVRVSGTAPSSWNAPPYWIPRPSVPSR